MALGWVSRVNGDPPLVGCGLGKHRYTAKGIEESRIFSINYPSADMITETDYCGIVSGKNTDKSSIFGIFYGEQTQVPMIAECPLTIECRLVQVVENQTHNFYIGEIVGTYADEKILDNDKPDIKKLNPLVPDNAG